MSALSCRIAGLGAALPEHRESNDDLAARLDTSGDWILTRTGIASRHVATTETTTGLAVGAARDALADAGFAPSDLDLIVVATSTPDTPCPATAARVAADLGTSAAAFDVNSACTGFVHALVTARSLLSAPGLGATGRTTPSVGGARARRALVIGADRYRSLTDPADRKTTVLFGDGAAAVVVEETTDSAPAGILGIDLRGDPHGLDSLQVPTPGGWLRMDGPEVFRRAVRGLVGSTRRALDHAGLTTADVDRFVPHQANVRIIEAVALRLGIPFDRVEVDLVERANTSAASIPLALHAAVQGGRIGPGDTVLLTAVGAGMGVGSIVLGWSR